MNLSQLVDMAFKVYNAQEARKTKQAMVSLERGWQDQRKMWDSKEKKSGPVGANVPIARRWAIGERGAQNSKGKVGVETLTWKC